MKEKQRRVGILEMYMSKTAGLTNKKACLSFFLATSQIFFVVSIY